MAAHVHNDSAERKPKVKKEGGAKVHLVAFAVSIVLTILAFVAVAYEVVPVRFTVPFIVLLAIVQAMFQLFVWMHMDQKGHEFSRIAIFGGLAVLVPVVISFVYWVW